MDIKRPILRWVFDRYYAYRYQEFVGKPQVMALDYAVRPSPRYGYGHAVHPGIAALLADSRQEYAELLDRLESHRQDFAGIALDPTGNDEPNWRNPYFSLLDAAGLFGLVADTRPRLYMEIGGGHSTRFARRAIRQHDTGTTIVSIDPQPRVEIRRLADEVVPLPLEELPASFFDRLRAGDILFLDGSHRVFQNSDVSVFFLDILPRLAPGVLIHLHDVFLPYDYPPAWVERYYSEQYMLAVALLVQPHPLGVLRPVLPNAYVSFDPQLRARAERIWRDTPAQALATLPSESWRPLGTSFWARWAGLPHGGSVPPGAPLAGD